MSYQVLARKWRPHTFTQVVGQEHVIRALANSIENQRMHHAYLFTGTRGVGKTTIARILAKALNCENRQGADPCGTCTSCIEIDQGCFVDLMEIDAASRTKVEDTRELLENVQYAPGRGQYKIYLIDEVHMLSGHSFNALLKTLEEPPPHVKFLLATTDPQKIPVTVLSRCLQFNLKRMQPEQIAGQMLSILEQERIPHEPAAVTALAIAADGSMRDGLSLLDQAIVFNSGTLEEAAVNDMLGTVTRRPVAELLRVLAAGDAAAVLAKVEDMSTMVADYSSVLQELLRLLHQVALFQAVPGLKPVDDLADSVIELARLISPADIQLFHEIAVRAQRDLPFMPTQRNGLEMALLRMLVFRPATAENHQQADDWQQTTPSSSVVPSRASPVDPSPATGREAAVTGDSNPVEAEDESGRSRAMDTAHAESPVAVSRGQSSAAAHSSMEWMDMIQAMRLGGMTRQLAQHCVLARLENNVCELQLNPEAEQLRTRQVESRLEEALRKYLGDAIVVRIETAATQHETPAVNLEKARVEKQQSAEAIIAADENIKVLKETFGAEIIPGSIKPVE